MSASDDRIVRIKLDNSDFERGAEQTIKTSERIEEALQFKNATNGFRNIEEASKEVKLDAIAESLSNLEDRFSKLGELSNNIFQGIASKALETAKSIEQATIGQIKSGGWKRAMNIADAQFRVEGLGYDWGAIKSAADYGVTDTAYGLDAAAKAASQLAASGVDFQETIETINGQDLTLMHKSLRGISGVAAMTNSDFESISGIFTSVAGRGRLQAVDLNRIAIRGINAAAALAKYIGVAESDIRDMTQKGLIDFETFALAMDESFGEHAKKANDTWAGSLSNMRAALSRIGALFAQPIVDKTNVFFNAITSRIKLIEKALKDVKDEEGNVVQVRFQGHFEEAWGKLIDFFAKVTNDLDVSGFQSVADWLDAIAVGAGNVIDILSRKYDEMRALLQPALDVMDDLAATTAEVKAAYDIWFKGTYGNGADRIKNLEKVGLRYKEVQKIIDGTIIPMKNTQKIWDEYAKIQKGASAATGETVANMAELQRVAGEARSKVTLSKIYEEKKGGGIAELEKAKHAEQYAIAQEEAMINHMFDTSNNIAEIIWNLHTVFTNVKETVVNFFAAVVDGFKAVFGTGEFLYNLNLVTTSLANISDALYVSEEGMSGVQSAAEGFFSIIKIGTDFIGGAIVKLAQMIELLVVGGDTLTEYGESGGIFTKIIAAIIGAIRGVVVWIVNLVRNVGVLFEKIKQTEGVQRLVKALKNLWDTVGGMVKEALDPFIKRMQTKLDSGSFLPTIDDIADAVGWLADKVAIFVENLPGWIDKAQKALSSFAGKVKGFFSNLGINKDTASNFGNKFLEIFTGEGTIFQKIMKFVGYIGDCIKSVLSKYDWSGVLEKGGQMLGLLSLLGVIRIVWKIGTLMAGVASVPVQLGRLFGGIASVFRSVSRALTLISAGYAIFEIGIALAAVGVVLYILAQLDEGALDRSVGALVIMAIVMVALAKFAQNLNGASIKGKLAGAAQTAARAIRLIAIAFALAAIIVSLKELTSLLATVDEDQIMFAFTTMALILLGIVAFYILFTLASRTFTAGSQGYKQAALIISMSFMTIAIGKAMAKMMSAMKDASEIDPGVIDKFTGMLATFMAMIAVLLLVSHFTTPAQTFGITILIAAIAGVMYLLIISLSTISAALGTMEFAGIQPKVEILANAIIAILGLVAIIIVLSGVAARLGGPQLASVMGSVTGMIAVIALLAAVIGIIVIKMGKVENADKLLDKLMIMMFGLIGLMTLMVILAVAAKKGLGVDIVSILNSIGSAFVYVAAAMAILGVAFMIMERLDPDKMGRTIGILLAFVGIVAVLGIIANLGSGGVGKGMKTFATALLMAGVAVLALGAGVYILNLALIMFADNSAYICGAINLFFATLAEHPVMTTIMIVLIAALIYAVIKFASTIGPLLSGIGAAIKTGAEAIGRFLKNTGKKAGDWFKRLGVRGKIVVVGLIAVLCAALLESGPKVMQTIGKLIILLLEFLGSIAGDLAFAIVKLLVQLINGIADAIRLNSAQILAAIFNVLTTVLELALQAVMRVFQWLTTGNSVGRAILKVFGVDPDEVADGFNLFISNMDEATNKWIADITASAKATDEAKEGYKQSLTDMEKSTESSGNAITGFMNSMLSKVKETTSGMKNQIDILEANLKRFDDIIPQAAKDQAAKAGKYKYNANGKGGSWTYDFDQLRANLSAEEQQIVGGLYDSMANGTANMSQLNMVSQFTGVSQSDLIGQFGNVTGNTMDTAALTDQFTAGLNLNYDQVMTDQASFGSEYVEQSGETATEATDKFRDNLKLDEVAKESTDKALAKIQERKPEFSDAGKDLGVSIGNSINSVSNQVNIRRQTSNLLNGMTEEVNNYTAFQVPRMMQALSDAMETSFRSENEINSPSRRYMRLASFLVDGIADGISGETSSAEGAFSTLSDVMISAFGNPIAYIAALMNGDIDYDPRIRPVVDMSSINSASGYIGAQFENQNVTLTGISGQLAADIGTLDDGNARIVEELKAMRQDMTYMAEQINGMQVVMDSGALVGQIATPLDREFGLRARLRGRG